MFSEANSHFSFLETQMKQVHIPRFPFPGSSSTYMQQKPGKNMGMRLVHDNVVTINTLAVSEAPTYTYIIVTAYFTHTRVLGRRGMVSGGNPPQKPQILTLQIGFKINLKASLAPRLSHHPAFAYFKLDDGKAWERGYLKVYIRRFGGRGGLGGYPLDRLLPY